MNTRMAVVSTGAVGATVGGLLVRAGHDVTFIDQWPANVEALKARGLKVTVGQRAEPDVEFQVPVHVLDVNEVGSIRGQFDVVLFACKSYDSRWMLPLIEPYLAADGVLVSMQNGFNDRFFSDLIGPERVIGCALTGGAELLEPGHAWRHHSLSRRYMTIGEQSGDLTGRVKDLAAILDQAGGTSVTSNIAGAKWSKLVANSASASLSSLVSANLRASELKTLPSYRDVFIELGREAIEVGKTLGYKMEPIFGLTPDELLLSPADVIDRLIDSAGEGRVVGATNMIQQDLRRGRPTEVVGFLNGFLMRQGKEISVPTPINDALTQLYAEFERGEIASSPENLVPLAKLIR